MRQPCSADLRWCCNICLWCVRANDVLGEIRGMLVWLSVWWEQIQLCISSTGYLTTTELLPRFSLSWQLANTIPHLLCVDINPPWLERRKSGVELRLYTSAGGEVLSSAMLALTVLLLFYPEGELRRHNLFYRNLGGTAVEVLWRRKSSHLKTGRKKAFCKIIAFV